MHSDDVVLIDRSLGSRRSSSILGSNNIPIETILEEEDDGDGDISASIEVVDDVHLAASEKPRAGKRTSFAPDPVHYREARGNGSSPSPDGSLGGFVSAVRRVTSVFTANSAPYYSESELYASGSETTPRRGGGRTTIFSRGSTTLSMASSDGDAALIESTILRDTTCLNLAQYNALRRLIAGRLWRYTCNFFIFVMIFGSQVQELWLPKSLDTTCDVVFTIAFVVLCFDIIFRSIIDPMYFSWRCGREMRQSNQGQRGRFTWLTGCNFAAGSFMFWCDVIGTLTFPFEIEYINPLLRQPWELNVVLSPLGVPLSGLNYGKTNGVARFSWFLVLAIGRDARLARFIRTTYIVETAANLNCIKYFHSRFWGQELNSMKNKLWGARETERNSATSEHGLPGNLTQLQSNSGRRTSFAASPSTSRLDKERKVFQDLAATVGIPKRATEEHLRPRQVSVGAQKRRRAGHHLKDSSSHIGAAMRELTGQRVAVGVFIAVVLNVLFTYTEPDGTPVMTMILLHGQTSNAKYATKALNIARSSVVPNLYQFQRYNDTGLVLSQTYELDSGRTLNDIRVREILNISIYSAVDTQTIGLFDISKNVNEQALEELVTTIFILVVWIIGVIAFAGPIMTLVVEPIERMVMLLSMLMKDPLGYQNSPQFHRLMEEEHLTDPNSNWDKEVLKGMETSFLMSTILRIGSLMQVGFGSAGTEIIRSGLERGRHKDVLFLNKQGSTVSCIFMFCDIRSFTDATECLQEEVFVFTNKIALVVHSICHCYGGSANKNIGDAFLVSWLLDDRPPDEEESEELSSYQNERLFACKNQADKALLAVVKISIALCYDNFFVENMKEEAKQRLLLKFQQRPGPLVQMGFGLHAGKAVQGAIGSTRKLDATYISESVERAEFLESNTKKYGTPLLMSDTFYNLLDSTNKYRCRKIDQLLLSNEDEPISAFADIRDKIESGEKMDLYTFDMDLSSIWKQVDDEEASTSSNELHASTSSKRKARPSLRRGQSTRFQPRGSSSNLEAEIEDFLEKHNQSKELVLPTGPSEYNERCWLAPDIRKIRRSYVSNGVIFPMFDSGLIAYYGRQWEHAKQCFLTVLAHIDDGPSRYYLKAMEKHNGVPPRDFIGYGLEE
ncbi:hypothetical protein HJC23_008772 [Cyclotella cryptica]|uniref:Guanylate cyclase domain-containing protein n=1 Tax=Cyclotella cryptica TaxID=29204 RepID=A0ABD3PDS7_9STRA|eukprot:CCRYP_015669-RB/>CCRYP_015669-RB protein AED:0.23 eAED:0.23 QI:280/1/1/1/0.75/0.71/21/2439/1126